jgi:hypothetical protein
VTSNAGVIKNMADVVNAINEFLTKFLASKYIAKEERNMK